MQAIGSAPAAGRRGIRLQRGAEAHPQGHQDRAGVRDRGEDAEVRHCRPLPLHRRLPGRDRRAHSGDSRLRQATALDEPGFPDADLLLQALSRAARWSSKPSRAAFACRRHSRPGRSSTTWPASPGPGSRRRNSNSSSASSSFTNSPGSGYPAASASCSSSRAIAATGTTTAGRSRCCLHAGWYRRRSCHDRAQAHLADQPDDHLEAQRALSSRGAESVGLARRQVRLEHHRRQQGPGLRRHRAAGAGGRRRRRGRNQRHGRPAAAHRHRGVAGDSRASSRRHPSSGAGIFRPSAPEAALNSPYVDYAIRGQGEETLARSCSMRSSDARHAALRAIAGLSWRSGGQIVHNKNRAFSAASLARTLPYERAGRSAAIPGPDLSRPAHHRLSGRAGLPLSLHLLRSGGDVSRQDRAARRRSGWSRTCDFLTHASRRGCHPILRSQLLRS